MVFCFLCCLVAINIVYRSFMNNTSNKRFESQQTQKCEGSVPLYFIKSKLLPSSVIIVGSLLDVELNHNSFALAFFL